MPATKLSKTGSTMHAAGIYADMTVDGPEIGTLVVIVDRAKNLPNRKSMGKQDPYCNCRLAKEAKKTKTDKRGGQVPRWDEEMRFTVRDSADYYQLKVSIFNDDKKTELIGESWVDLSEVVKPGGGQSDIWHNLNCKGKYAGEVRLEMTYYDSRPKPEKSVVDEAVAEEKREAPGSRQTPVKRRPLPSDPVSGNVTPEPVRAGGPRDLGTPSRPLPQPVGARSSGNTPSSNRRTVHSNQQPIERQRSQNFYPETPDDVFGGPPEPAYAQSQQDTYSQFGGYEPQPPPQSQNQDYQYQDNPMTGLPELPPMTNHRRQGSNRPQQQDSYRSDYSQPTPPRPQPELHHAHSAPQVPVTAAPYPEDMMHPRDTFQHTQSDQYMNHGRPVSRNGRPVSRQAYDDPYSRPHDDYSPHHPEPERRSSYSYPGQPQYNSPQRSPAHEGYDHIPQNSVYRQPSSHFERPVSRGYDMSNDAPPPPPPAHRDSTPSRDAYSGYAPAPLNITPIRRSPSPLPSIEQDPYAAPQQQYGTPEYGFNRRNTAPIETSPQDSHIYRPRARSGDAMRPVSRDSRNEDPYTLPPSHPDYHSPTTYNVPEFPTPSNRRDSYRPPYEPATRSPLAVESPHSFRDDRSSLPSQSSQSTPLRGSDLYNGTLPARTMPGSASRNSPYSNHHYSSSEPFVSATTNSYQTPPRHPLAQQIGAGSSPSGYGVHPTPPQDGPALVKPIAVSPVHTPGSDVRGSRTAQRSTPTTRKSVSPRPSMVGGASSGSNIFDNPDSFSRFNPAALSSTSSLVNHPATSSHGSTPAGSPAVVTKEGKIVDFHGNHIDPSDRLPETSWAPEPEPKVAPKEYGTNPRSGGGVRGARDLNVTFVNKNSPRQSSDNVDGGSPVPSAGSGGGGVIRARLRKKERPSSAIVMAGGSVGSGAGIHDRPFRDIPNPAGPPPLQTQDSYSSTSASYGGYGSNSSPTHHRNSYAGPGAETSSSPRYSERFFGNGNGPAAPPIPAKIPMNSQGAYGSYAGSGGRGDDALARELSSIDLGPSGGRVARGRMLGFRN